MSNALTTRPPVLVLAKAKSFIHSQKINFHVAKNNFMSEPKLISCRWKMHFMSPIKFHVAAKISCRRENDFMSPQKFHVAETWFHVAEKISCRREKWFHVGKMISCRQKLFHVAKNDFHVAKSGFHVAENNFMPERRSTFRMSKSGGPIRWVRMRLVWGLACLVRSACFADHESQTSPSSCGRCRP